jgi:hypothetical protein
MRISIAVYKVKCTFMYFAMGPIKRAKKLAAGNGAEKNSYPVGDSYLFSYIFVLLSQ